MIPKKVKTLILAPLLLAVLLALAAGAFQHFYRRQLWDPQTMALVNGRPLPISALEEVINMGYHQPFDLNEADGQEALARLLDRLIDEELIERAAEKEGLSVEAWEIEAYLAGYGSSLSRPGQSDWPMGGSEEALAKTVRKRLLLKRVSELVAKRDGLYDSLEWRLFFRNFLAKYSFSAVYRVRVLLVQEALEAENLLTALLAPSGPKTSPDSLELLAEKLRQAGLEAKVAGPMSLNLMAPETFKTFKQANIGPEFSKALERPNGLTSPLKLSGSLAIFEVLEIIKQVNPEELARAAQNQYERQVGERAFNLWLAKLRREAKIELNPNLTLSGDDSKLTDLLKPKVPWGALTPWEEAAPDQPEDPLNWHPDRPNTQGPHLAIEPNK
ncbi:MAG: SurA N-terminal domain-containing protein, partial [Deltaproteobacteria bacterium]|nr:SurA N-terminal domain-containing protein [Deltaproteobacteria bacterium]